MRRDTLPTNAETVVPSNWTRQIAIDSARYITTMNPGAELTVRNLTTGEVTVVKHPNQK